MKTTAISQRGVYDSTTERNQVQYRQLLELVNDNSAYNPQNLSKSYFFGIFFFDLLFFGDESAGLRFLAGLFCELCLCRAILNLLGFDHVNHTRPYSTIHIRSRFILTKA